MKIIDEWIAKRPEWFVQARIDIEPGQEGWHQLIDEVFKDAEKIVSKYTGANFGIAQVKEKLGALRIYFHHDGLPVDASEQLNEMKFAAEDRSLHVCEICGAPGHLGRSDRWLSVRCSTCAPAGWKVESIEC